MYISLLLIVSCFASGVLMTPLPPPCNPENGSCLEELGNMLKHIVFSASPELGVESSDPLFVKEINGDVSGFKYKLIDSTFVGLSSCFVSSLIVNPDITKFQFDMDCPKLTINGKYEVNGQLLGLPAEGSGDCEIITGRYNLHFDGNLEKAQDADGKTLIKITEYKLETVPQGPMQFRFENMFNGQKDLSDAFHKTVHENWKPLAELFQKPIWSSCMDKIVDNINSFLKHFSLDNFLSV